MDISSPRTLLPKHAAQNPRPKTCAETFAARAPPSRRCRSALRPRPEPPEANPALRTSRRLSLVMPWKGLKEMAGYQKREKETTLRCHHSRSDVIAFAPSPMLVWAVSGQSHRGQEIGKRGRMEAFVWGAAIIGGALLFCSTVILVYFNWSEKVFAPIYSIVLVGTATALVTVLLTLKETTAEDVFTTSIVFDQAVGAPPLIILDPQNPGITSRLLRILSLRAPNTRPGKLRIHDHSIATKSGRTIHFHCGITTIQNR